MTAKAQVGLNTRTNENGYHLQGYEIWLTSD